jgi:hypothetical protein
MSYNFIRAILIMTERLLCIRPIKQKDLIEIFLPPY